MSKIKKGNILNWLDTIFQIILALAAITLMNRLLFHDSLIVSIGCAAAVTACFWLGRGSVRFFKRRKQMGRLTGE